MANRYRAFGAVLSYSTDNGATWTDVAGLTNFSSPSGDTEEIDATAHDSVGAYRETLAGFKDPGEAPIEGYYDPADDSHKETGGLPGLYGSGQTVKWKITIPDSASPANEVTFDGWVKTFQLTFPADGMMGFTGSIRATGPTSFPG